MVHAGNVRLRAESTIFTPRTRIAYSPDPSLPFVGLEDSTQQTAASPNVHFLNVFVQPDKAALPVNEVFAEGNEHPTGLQDSAISLKVPDCGIFERDYVTYCTRCNHHRRCKRCCRPVSPACSREQPRRSRLSRKHCLTSIRPLVVSTILRDAAPVHTMHDFGVLHGVSGLKRQRFAAAFKLLTRPLPADRPAPKTLIRSFLASYQLVSRRSPPPPIQA